MKPELAGMEVETPRVDAIAHSSVLVLGLAKFLERESAAKDQELARMREALKGVIAEADRDTDAFILARSFLSEEKK